MTKRKKNDKFTEEMKDYLQLQYDRNPVLGERAQKIADDLKSTKKSIQGLWTRLRKDNNNPGTIGSSKWTPGQLEILERRYNADKNFSPSQVVNDRLAA